MVTISQPGRQSGTTLAISIALVGVVVALLAAALITAIDRGATDSQSVVRPAPLSYHVEGAGEGLIGGESHLAVPAVTSYHVEGAGDGLIDGANVTPPVLFDLEGQPIGRMQSSGNLSVERPMSRYEPFAGDVGLTEAGSAEIQLPGAGATLTAQWIVFWEANVTGMPGYVEADALPPAPTSDRQRFSKF